MLSNKRGQAALEYLITYGWALVAIATIIGVLVMASSGSVNSNSCTTFLTLLCKGIAAEGDQLIMVMQNAAGQKITINPFTDIAFDGQYGYAKITYQGQEYRFEEVTIGAGEEFTITADGMVLSNEVAISYVESQTGITRTVTSSMGTDAPDDIEISNDGIDNDGDGDTDCADTEESDCEYSVTLNGPMESSTTPITFTFESEAINDIPGYWDIKAAYLYVYITNTSLVGTRAKIDNQLAPAELVTGWNVIAIDGFSRDLVQEAPTLLLDGTNFFTITGISSATPPRLVIKLEEGDGGI